jgi:hypothetical protein
MTQRWNRGAGLAVRADFLSEVAAIDLQLLGYRLLFTGDAQAANRPRPVGT